MEPEAIDLFELIDDLEGMAAHDVNALVKFEVWIGDADEPVIADEYLSIGHHDGVVTIALGAKGNSDDDYVLYGVLDDHYYAGSDD